MLSCQRNGLALAKGFALLAALGVGFLLGPAACRADTPPYYMKDREFEIPYASDADQNLKQVHLFVSTDRKSYSAIATTALRRGAFPYTAKADGEYFFVVQVEDANGTLRPQRPELAEPTCRIVVDTQKPQIDFRAVQPKQGRAAVEWRITDPNLDLRTLRLETKGPGESAWTPHQITLLQAAQYGWNPVGNGPIEVRLFVKDLAGNEAAATTQVTPSANSIPAPGGTDNAQVIHVKHKKFRLTYQIAGAGPSSVKEVQVWMTRDKSQWSKHATASPTGTSVEVTVPTTGRYGFTLRPISGVGRGPAPPRGGDAPRVWVEVDDIAPAVKLNNVHVGEGADSGVVIVNWSATDKFLKDKPVTIYYGKSAAGPWEVLQADIENTGTAKVTPPAGVFEFFVKIDVVDKAGNKGSAQLPESIKVDLSVPMAAEVGVEAIDPNSPGTAPPASPSPESPPPGSPPPPP